MLQLDRIHSFYGKSCILQGVSLYVNAGEIVTILGRNGVGKTTTLKSILGLVKVTSGSIIYKGVSVIDKKAFEIFRKGIGYVPQGRNIFSSLTLLENLTLASGKSSENIEEVLSIFPTLKKRLYNRGNQLSGGEQQMLAIARVLICKPELILMDEPSEGLAPMMINLILQALLNLKEEGITVLMVEANLNMATSLGDRHYIMDQGTIACTTSTQHLVQDKTLLDRYLMI